MSQVQVQGFRPATARRILKQLNIEGTEQLPSGYPFPDDGARTAIAYTHSGTITARSGATVGTGVATLYKINDSDALVPQTDSAGSNIIITVKNLGTSVICAGAYIRVRREYLSGRWIADADPFINIYIDGLYIKGLKESGCIVNLIDLTDCSS